ncbi:hypothetical protein ACVJBD_005865 [Rhizobium mongolense]
MSWPAASRPQTTVAISAITLRGDRHRPAGQCPLYVRPCRAGDGWCPDNGSARVSAAPSKRTICPASVTGLPESIPFELNPSPSACFCPQSTLGRCSMGSAEDRLINLRRAVTLVLLPDWRPNPSIVPAKGPCSGWLMVVPARNLLLSPSGSGSHDCCLVRDEVGLVLQHVFSPTRSGSRATSSAKGRRTGRANRWCAWCANSRRIRSSTTGAILPTSCPTS